MNIQLGRRFWIVLTSVIVVFSLFVIGRNAIHAVKIKRQINTLEHERSFYVEKIALDSALLEPQLEGREVTCGVLGDQSLPPILIEPAAGDFFDYTSKYAKGGAREICPAPLPQEVLDEAGRLALAAHRALGLAGYSRTDFILSPEGRLTLLEVNTLPGMTPTSLVPQEAAVIGLDFGALLERLIELGLERHGARQ